MGDLLKEAIADAKAVRETALANAKMALEEAFTPQLKSMLSAKLKEDEFEDEEEFGGEDLRDLNLHQRVGSSVEATVFCQVPPLGKERDLGLKLFPSAICGVGGALVQALCPTQLLSYMLGCLADTIPALFLNGCLWR